MFLIPPVMCSPLKLIGNKQSRAVLVKETERVPFKCNVRVTKAGMGEYPEPPGSGLGSWEGWCAFFQTAEAGCGHGWNIPAPKIGIFVILLSALPGV